MTAVFKITDGTTTIDMLSLVEYGFHIDDWPPDLPFYKGGGTWRDSPAAAKRAPAIASRMHCCRVGTLMRDQFARI